MSSVDSDSTESDQSASSGQCLRKLSMWNLRPPPAIASKSKTAVKRKLNTKLKHSNRLTPDQFLSVSASKQSLMSQFLISSKVDGTEVQDLKWSCHGLLTMLKCANPLSSFDQLTWGYEKLLNICNCVFTSSSAQILLPLWTEEALCIIKRTIVSINFNT